MATEVDDLIIVCEPRKGFYPLTKLVLFLWGKGLITEEAAYKLSWFFAKWFVRFDCKVCE